MNLDAVIQLHAAGDMDGAEHGYRSLIAQNPDVESAYENLALICLKAGRTDEAIELLQSALKLSPGKERTYHNLAVAFIAQGKLDDAVACYRQCIQLAPENPDTHYFLGNVVRLQGRLDDAISCYQRVTQLKANYPDAYLNFGNVLKEMGRVDDAIACYYKLVELNPQYPEGYNNLGLALALRGKLDDAIACYRQALQIRPGFAEAYTNLGLALGALGKLDDALFCQQKAIETNANHPEAYSNLGVALQELNRLDEAVGAYRKSIELRPDYAHAHNNLGAVLQKQRKLDEAISAFHKSIELKPDNAEAYNNLGIALQDQEKLDDAISCYRTALEIKTSHLEPTAAVKKVAGLLIELLRIPSIYQQTSEIRKCRDHYMTCLTEASSLVANQPSAFSAEQRDILREIIFRITNFYVAYQQFNDRELQVTYSQLLTKILAPEISAYLTMNKVERSGSKIRLGIASEYLKSHNGAIWAYGWLANLPRQDYEFFVYSLNGTTDEITRKFAALGTYRWLPFRHYNYLNSLQVIKQDNLDVLLIPDVGMSASSRVISLTRLAPVQCVGWGHPTTNGSSNIDYYLSSELMETAESDNHYSEKLVRLPNTGLHFDCPEVPAQALNRSDFGIPEGKIVYGAVQSLFKYLPQFDLLYPAIAKVVPNAWFVFVGSDSHGVTAAFEKRLKRSFEQSGLEFENYVQILPRMQLTRFMQLLGVLDVYLDSIGWNGGITTLRSLTMDCPVVTWPGEFMRGRHSYAMLELIGLRELIASDLDDYISLAARIGLDSNLRSDLVKKIKTRKHKLYNDNECVAYLDRFFKSLVPARCEVGDMNWDAVTQLHAAGDLAVAEQGYRSLIARDQNLEAAYGNLALICLDAGRTDEAIELLQSALKLDPANRRTHLNLAVAFIAQGKLENAVACYRQEIQLRPDNAETHYYLGNVVSLQGQLDDAVNCYQKAIQLRDNYPDAYLNLGNVLKRMGRLDDAITCNYKLVELNPQFPEGYNNLGLALVLRGKFDEAITCYRQALQIRPGYAEAYTNMGFALCALGKLDDALACQQKAIEINPNHFEAYNNLGVVFQELNRSEDAACAYRKAIELRPDCAQGYNNLGAVFQNQRKLDQAISAFRKAIELQPDYAEVYNNLGMALQDEEKVDDAISCYQTALEIKTFHLESTSPVRNLARPLTELLRIPSIYKHASEVRKCRDNYTACLTEASSLVASPETIFSAHERNILREAIFRRTNFYLAYQQCNDRDLQVAYCQLVTEILRPEISPYLTLNKVRRADSRIKLGIASEYLKSHNGAFWAYGWLANLPADDYEFFIYSLNGATDEITRKFAALGTYRWLPFRHDNYLNSLEVIKQDNLDVLLIPDVGMSASSRVISLTRLAPVQCVGWGHPTTSGSSTIDYYLSSELMETAESDSHYSEKLVRLPNTGMHIDRPEVPAEVLTRSDFGLPENKPLYGAVQSLFKYLPQYDYIYPAIAKQVPDALFVFVGSDTAGVTAAFEQRLRDSFEQSGLQFEQYVKILPRMPFSRFMQLLCVLDVSLDSIGFNGGTTAMRAVSMNCPVVTLVGKTMIDRAGYAMLKMIGLDELTTSSLDEYISLSARIGLDRQWRLSLVDKIKASKHLLFNDNECVTYLDQFLKSKVEEIRKLAHKGPERGLLYGMKGKSLAVQNKHLKLSQLKSAVHRLNKKRKPGSLDLAPCSIARERQLLAGTARSTAAEASGIQALPGKHPETPEEKFGVADSCSRDFIASGIRKPALSLDAVIQLHAAGNLVAAEQGYRDLISQNPDGAVAYENLALICLAAGRTDEGIALVQSALKLNPDNPETHLNLGVARKTLGDLEGAISSYHKALELRPNYPEAYNNLGVVLPELDLLDEAIGSLKKALELKPNYAQAHYNLGNLYGKRLLFEDALACYRQVLELQPVFFPAYLNLGNLLRDNGRLEDAIACYQRALEVCPDAQIYNNLGNIFLLQGKMDKALACLDRAVEIRPDYSEGYNNRGNALREMGRADEARASFARCLELTPDYPEAHFNLGNAFNDQHDSDAAMACFRKALELRPNYAEAYNSLGLSLAGNNRMDDAVAAYQRSLEIKAAPLESTSLVLRLGLLLNGLERIPVVYRQQADIKKSRDHFSTCLSEALNLVSMQKRDFSAEERAILRQILFRITNFYLVYQQENDRDLQILYSWLMTDILKPEIEPYLKLDQARASDSRIRLGIASEYLKHHNGSSWAYGWLSNLPREDYQFFVYSLNGKTDAYTQRFAQLGTYRWLPFRQHSYLPSLEVIKEDKLDVLLLPDVGMTASSKIISLLRLAPVQCVGWGHPVTTGSPNMDYYLGCELMETEESDSHYSEQLIRLPKIGVHIEPPRVPADVLDRSDFGIPENRIVYGAVQTLFKYLPQFDFVYPAIAKQVPNAHFVFVGNQSPGVTADFQCRLKNSFEQAGIDFEEHVTILPHMPLERFMQLLGVLDVYLDSIGFSGGMTAMRSLSVDCPVLTLSDKFMRGRLGYAMLKMIGLEELIASSLDDYIALAGKIGLDSQLRSALVKKIKARKHKLFNDFECVAYLDKFLKAAVGKSRLQATRS